MLSASNNRHALPASCQQVYSADQKAILDYKIYEGDSHCPICQIFSRNRPRPVPFLCCKGKQFGQPKDAGRRSVENQGMIAKAGYQISPQKRRHCPGASAARTVKSGHGVKKAGHKDKPRQPFLPHHANSTRIICRIPSLPSF